MAAANDAAASPICGSGGSLEMWVN